MQRFTSLFAGAALAAVSYQVACQGEDTHQERKTPAFKTRNQHIQEVQNNNQYDVLVIGGGCNGVGVLLDSSTRGLRTLLIDREDFGAGASSKSTKLIHGGVRYLQQVFDFSFASMSSRVEKFNLVK